jgi:hypothetical protein
MVITSLLRCHHPAGLFWCRRRVPQVSGRGPAARARRRCGFSATVWKPMQRGSCNTTDAAGAFETPQTLEGFVDFLCTSEWDAMCSTACGLANCHTHLPCACRCGEAGCAGVPGSNPQTSCKVPADVAAPQLALRTRHSGWCVCPARCQGAGDCRPPQQQPSAHPLTMPCAI